MIMLLFENLSLFSEIFALIIGNSLIDGDMNIGSSEKRISSVVENSIIFSSLPIVI